MDQNNENSFWKSNIRTVPGRPSPKKDNKSGRGSSATSSFENYQKSVSDAWNLSEDELTKEYCILSSENDSKLPPRRPQNTPKVHHNKNQLPVVHKASSSSNNNLTTANNINTSQPYINNDTNAIRSLSLGNESNKLKDSTTSVEQIASNAVSEKSSNSSEYG